MKRCELCGTPVKVVGNVTKHYEPVENPIKLNDGNCYVCGDLTESLSANPSLWGFYFAHIDGDDKHRHYHMKCLYPILNNTHLVALDEEKVYKFILNEMEDLDRPKVRNWIFHKPLYPSSGVENMHLQDQQVRDLSKKFCSKFATKSEPVKITESEIISIVNNAYYGMGNGTYDIKELSFRIAQAIHNALYGCGE